VSESYVEYEDGTRVWSDGVVEYPDGAYGHVDDLEPDDFLDSDEPADDDRLDELLEAVSDNEGRDLTAGEVARIAELDRQAQNRGEADVDVTSALNDTTTPQGRIRAVDERIADLAPANAPETVTPLAPDASAADRVAYLNARMAGAEIAEPQEDE
jgi:hypothetical protein